MIARAALFARASPLSSARAAPAINRQHYPSEAAHNLQIAHSHYGVAARVVGVPLSLMMKTRNVAGRV